MAQGGRLGRPRPEASDAALEVTAGLIVREAAGSSGMSKSFVHSGGRRARRHRRPRRRKGEMLEIQFATSIGTGTRSPSRRRTPRTVRTGASRSTVTGASIWACWPVASRSGQTPTSSARHAASTGGRFTAFPEEHDGLGSQDASSTGWVAAERPRGESRSRMRPAGPRRSGTRWPFRQAKESTPIAGLATKGIRGGDNACRHTRQPANILRYRMD
jgi:hypothetical protein